MTTTLSQTGWKKHNLCPTHGRSYLLLTDLNHPAQTGFCAHPDCIDKIINSLSGNPMCGGLIRFVKKLDKDRGADINDFRIYLLEGLLKGATKGKVTVANPWHMRWTCLSYLKELKKQEDIIKFHNEILQQIHGMMEDEVNEYIEDMGLGTFTSGVGQNITQRNPEKQVAFAEILKLSVRKWGSETHLWLMKELSDVDMCKISGLSLKDLPQVKLDWQEWYEDLQNEYRSKECKKKIREALKNDDVYFHASL